MWGDILQYTVFGLLVLINAAGVVLVVLQLPGTWLILAATSLVAWWQWDQGVIGWWALLWLAVLAVLGEVIETIAGVAGSARSGGTKRAGLLSLIGGIIGALIGAPLAFPIGSLLGACVGAAAGSYLGDSWAGRSVKEAFESGKGAARGRLMGTVGKVAVAVLMWLVATVSLFV